MKYKLAALLVTFICANVLLFSLWDSKVVLDVRKIYNYNYKKIKKQYAEPIFKSHNFPIVNNYGSTDDHNDSFNTALVNISHITYNI